MLLYINKIIILENETFVLKCCENKYELCENKRKFRKV